MRSLLPHYTRLALVAISTLSFAPIASAYSGMLFAEDGGLDGIHRWFAPPTTLPADLSWDVTQNVDDSWHYVYRFRHARGDVSHFILETSTTFLPGDVSTNPGFGDLVDVGNYSTADPDNPALPSWVYGARFAPANDFPFTEIRFDTGRAPIWGDFYAVGPGAGVGEEKNAGWNSGFTSSDTDPNAAPADGSIDGHLLVPGPAGPVPEPQSFLLLGMGLVGSLGMIRRRRS